MRQFNFEYPSLEAALSGLADIRNVLESEKAAGRCSDALLLVFTTCLDNEEMGKFLRALDNALPGVKRAGISETPRERYVKLNLMTAERSSFHAAQFPCEPGQEAETAAAFSDFLNGIEDARGVGLFPSGKTLNVTEFLEAAFAEREDLPVFGALANGMFKLSQPISRYEPEREALSGIGVELLDSGFTVVVFSGRELAVYADYILGWHPIGREFKFKPGDKPPYGETAIEEIDGRPAVELYKKYLGVEWSGEFTWNVCEFPLMVRRNGADVCLVPLVQDRSGEIYFSGTVREGERLRLSYGTRNDILGSSYDGSQRMRRFAPEAVFLSLCGNRLIYLRDEAHLEWDFYREHFPELVYCHGYSEVYYHGGKGGVLNSSFIAVGFREGPGPSATFEPLKCGKHRDGRYSECPECEACTRRNECKAGTERLPLSNDGVIPLPYRMSHFLQVMTGELEEMTEKAEAANRAKSAFLSSMSHEIRTPINAVLGMDEMILREATEKNILEYAGNIRTAGNSLLGLINDILDFSKIEAGKMELIPVEYEMASVLNDLANMISKRAEDKGLKLIVEAAQDIPSSLRGDELRLKQAVINILTNAVKYTQQGSVTFRVGCERDGGDAAILSFSVTDTGIGIKEEDMSRLFSPFERLDEGRNHSVEGTGLGMAITTQILSKMGSKLEVQSVYGEGSTFSFKVRQEIVNPEPMGDFQEVFRRSLAKRAEYHESFWAPDARVLAVDDMFINLAVFRGLLKRTKVRVDTAQSGEECLAKLTKNTYDLIFLDHRMPGMDGVETFRRMKDLPGNKNLNTPVIALTANAVSGAKEEYRALGFAGYLSKPTDAAALEKLLKRTLPPEKVQLPSEDVSAVTKAEGTGASAETEAELPQVEGLDWGFAELHLPSRELLAGALRDFHAAIVPHADKLDGFYNALPDAWDDYRVLVHGMKSSAATVGIVPLAGVAKMLEYAARDRDRETVSALHGPFLREWRSYLEKLKGVFGIGAAGEGTMDFDPNAVRELIKTIRSSAEDFDIDEADAAVERMGKFRLPPELMEGFQTLRTAINDVDTDAALRAADEILRGMENE